MLLLQINFTHHRRRSEQGNYTSIIQLSDLSRYSKGQLRGLTEQSLVTLGQNSCRENSATKTLPSSIFEPLAKVSNFVSTRSSTLVGTQSKEEGGGRGSSQILFPSTLVSQTSPPLLAGGLEKRVFRGEGATSNFRVILNQQRQPTPQSTFLVRIILKRALS